MKLPLGTVVHDSEGKAWVYVGFRITTIHTRNYLFVKCLSNDYSPANLPHMYQASSEQTLLRKFPDLADATSTG